MAQIFHLRGDTVVDSFELAEGLTVRQAVYTLCPDKQEFTAPTIAIVGGSVRLREEWDMPLPAETIVTFVEVPRGGGGGSSNPLQILFMVVISILAIVASVFTAGATLALLGATGSLIAAGMAGMAVIWALCLWGYCSRRIVCRRGNLTLSMLNRLPPPTILTPPATRRGYGA